MNWIQKIEHEALVWAASNAEHGIDHTLDALFASGNPANVEATVNHFFETSPYVKLLGGIGALAVPLIEGEIDSLIEHNENAVALAQVKDYVHERLKVK